MVLITFLLLLCMQGILFASGETIKLSGRTVKISFSDDRDDKGNPVQGEYPIERVQHFAFIKEILEDLGASDVSIPLSNIQKPVFDFLIDIIKMDIVTLSFNAMRSLVKPLLKNKNDATILLKDLLVAAHYLDVQPVVIQYVIANAYADTLKSQKFEEVKFDDIPKNLYKLVAGWLLHDLLMEKQWDEQELLKTRDISSLGLNTGDIGRLIPIISSTSMQHGFNLFWKEHKKGLWYTFLPDYTAFLDTVYVDLFDMNMPLKKVRLSADVARLRDLVMCATSEDGKNFLIIDHHGEIPSAKEKDGQLYARVFPQNKTIEFNEARGSLYILDLFFNNTTRTFHVIASKNWKPGIPKKNEEEKRELVFYEIELNGQKKVTKFDISTPDKPGHFVLTMKWHLVGEDLVGLSYSRNEIKPYDIVLYKTKEKELFKCDLTKAGVLIYIQNNKELEAPILVAEISGKKVTVDKEEYLRKIIPISNSFFIPSLASILSTVSAPVIYLKGTYHAEQYIIDMLNFRVNFFNQDEMTCGMRYFFPPELTMAMLSINAELSDSTTVLSDALLLYQYYKGGITLDYMIERLSSRIKVLYVKSDSSTVQPSQSLKTPAPAQSFFESLRRNPSQLWVPVQQRIQALPSLYRKMLYGVGALSVGGLAAWLWARYNPKLQVIRP